MSALLGKFMPIEAQTTLAPPVVIPVPKRPFDRHLIGVLVLAAAVLFPRAALIAGAHSERVDDEYHLIRGIKYLKRQLGGRGALPLNDPPLGEGISALPNLVTGCLPDSRTFASGLYGYRLSADSLLMLIALWKTLLFLPGIALIFIWCRSIYSARAAWLAISLVLIDPTFAAHIPLPTIDVLGVEGILFACFCIWRYFEKPTIGRCLVGSFAVALALMLKHTAIILPGVTLIIAFLWWIVLPRLRHVLRDARAGRWRLRGRDTLLAILFVGVFIWALSLFDFSKPAMPEDWDQSHPRIVRLLNHHLPAGIYVSSLLEGMSHGSIGHPGYLFGKVRKNGWWYYFPVVATYKIPIGTGIVLACALLSLIFIRPRWQEWSLLVPAVAWTAFMMNSKIDIGFRHFLPAYLFMLMLASRVVLAGRALIGIAIGGVTLAAIHVASYHPDYLSYINFPRHKPFLDISDSNVDWGQSLKQVREWIVAHPGRKIFYRDFGWGETRLPDVRSRVGDVAVLLDRGQTRLPVRGILIISAVAEAGVYEKTGMYRALHKREPIAVIGHCVSVYDLDQLSGGKRFHWPAPKIILPKSMPTTSPATSPATRKKKPKKPATTPTRSAATEIRKPST